MSSIYATTISSEKYIIINSQNIELSGNIIMKEHVTISNGLLNTNSIVPNVTNSASLGSTSSSWSNAYIRDLSVNNNLQVTGNVKISENLDVSNIYTKNYIDNSFANVYTRTHIDLSFANVYNRSHIDQSFQNVYTIEQFDNLYANVYTSDHIDNSFQNVYNIEHIDNSFQNVYTRIHIDNSFTKVYTIKQFDNSYANVYTRDHVDLSFGNVYNREHVDNSFANVYTITQFDNSYADVYTRIQVDNSFAYKQLFDASYNALAIGGGGESTSSIELSLVSSNIIPLTTNNVSLGSTTQYWNNSYINNLRVFNRAYQEISGDISWNAVNGYYGLAKDAYPSLNPYSSGVLAVSSWTKSTSSNETNTWRGVCWSPELRLFVAVASDGTNRVMTSPNGINWTARTPENDSNNWISVCWSPELRIFVAVASGGTNLVMTSPDGITWTGRESSNETNAWFSVCWSSELGIFAAVSLGGTNQVMTSPDGTTWTGRVAANEYIAPYQWFSICWSPQLGLFAAVAQSGTNDRVMTSPDGINWTSRTTPTNNWESICWSPELGLFAAVAWTETDRVMTSPDGINWTGRVSPSISWDTICWCNKLGLFVALAFAGSNRVMTSPDGINWTGRVSAHETGFRRPSVCWSPELGLVVAVYENNTNRVITSSLKGRPPTSYNVFDSSFNSIDETSKWDFSNIAVTTLNVTGTFTNSSDDRLKHNEVVIANGLDVIDRLNPKFYQKTQVMLDTSYNGDLNGLTWTYEAGLIAQEVLQIPDLSFVISGGDYYQESYILNNQSNDISTNYYDTSANYYDISANNYDISTNNYELSNNVIAQPYTLNYNSIFVYGLAAIKELHAKVKAQDISLLTQQTIINTLTTKMQALETNPNNS
jgi:ASC-1-like (ASCH) protein